MARTYYSDYVNHCLRFYIKHNNPTFRSQADKENWTACDLVFKQLEPEEREMLFEIYKGGNVVLNMYDYIDGKNIKQEAAWKLINSIERKVAKKRGLL